jgi:hypothetical protein
MRLWDSATYYKDTLMVQRQYGLASTPDEDFPPPPTAQLQAAQRANPTQAAAAAAFNDKTVTPGSSLGPGAYQALKQNQTAARQSRGAYGVPTNTPNNWYGKGNEYGMSLMAGDTNAFWTGYGDQVAGWQPGGDMTSFYADKYDTQALGATLFGKQDWSSDEGRMAGQSAIADRLNQPGVQFFDPGQLVGNVMSALMSRDPEALAKQNPQLAILLQQTQGNPAGQPQVILGFLQQVLSASMPPDALQAFIGQLNALSDSWLRDIMRSPKGPDQANFAQYLVQTLGPTLGL